MPSERPTTDTAASDLPLGPTPEWLVHQLDPATDQAVLLSITEPEYRQASFLDQRAIGPAAQLRPSDWRAIGAAIDPAWRRDAQFIFHIGNVGSTLLSRLLGEHPGILALREPLLLRTWADWLGPVPGPVRWSGEEANARLDLLTALLSRTYRPDQRALVKATSFTSEIAWRLLPPSAKALFLFASPQPYIENILGGPNSRQALEYTSPARLARLQSRCPGLTLDLAALGPARKAALGWACEMSSLRHSEARMPAGSVLWLDFDRFLADPAGQLAAVAAHFDVALTGRDAQALCAGPLMRRYSKALEYEFTPATRREILAEARRAHGPAIRDALGWLVALAARYPAVADAIRVAQRGS